MFGMQSRKLYSESSFHISTALSPCYASFAVFVPVRDMAMRARKGRWDRRFADKLLAPKEGCEDFAR
jgi:uncharacterized protein (DUF2461 family)